MPIQAPWVGLLRCGLGIPILAGTVSLALLASQEKKAGEMHPSSLRSYAVSAPLPDYPSRSSAAGKAGVAVAEIVASADDGSVTSVRLLESPDPSTGEAVAAAVSHWRFRFPPEVGTAFATLRSRVSFYFRLEGGRPAVVDAVAEDLRARPRPRTSPTH